MSARFDAARAVADAVLFEGYVLYPYRASAPKNQVRWQWGVLFPRAFAEADGYERWRNRTECVVDPGSSPRLTVRVRGLHVQHRSVEVDGARVSEVQVDGVPWVPWDEAVEWEVDLPPVALLPLREATHEELAVLPGGEEREPLRSADGTECGVLVRRREPVDVVVNVAAEWAAGDGALVKVTARVENATVAPADATTRDGALPRALVAVHVLLGVDDGTFVSLLDPDDGERAAVAGCDNDGTFPVLVGSDDRVMLAAPIILYDHPEIAPESDGDLCDATEIDEILALRVLTLTDEEKAEARATDPRAAAIVDRIDDMAPETFARLHGTLRELRPLPEEDADVAVPWWEPAVDAAVDPWTDTLLVHGVEVAAGTRVRLRPTHRADAQDMFLRDMVATVAGVFHDVDDELHVAVTVDDDPATEALLAHGRYLYFHPDEIQPLASDESESRAP
ncbi:MAG TPA: hypothetical protein VIA11_22235 [Acidimicrobiia bacterium]|nr:hypothetical protein [Acidimicrobiia bacterium]